MRIMLFKSFLIVCLWSSAASASLIERDYLGVAGGITYDSNTNYEWLDLSFTRSMDLNQYQNYLSELDAGWMFSSSKLVSELLTNFDFTSALNNDYGTANVQSDYVYYKPLETMFVDLVDDLTILGESVSGGMAMYGMKGFTSDRIGGAHQQFMAYYNGNKSLGVAAYGDYYRVPTGKSIQSFFTYREAVAQENVSMMMVSANSQAIDVPEPGTLGLFSLVLCLMGFRQYKN